MDSINFYNIKVEKAKALPRHRQLQKIANLCRVIEVCVVLVLISRFSMQLPLAVKNSTGYFHEVKVVLVSPRFVFVIGNVIIFTLFAKSGQFSARAANTSGLDLYEEFFKNSEKKQRIHPDMTSYPRKISVSDESTFKDYRRIQSFSQNSNSGLCEKSLRVLRRLETQKCSKNTGPSDEVLAKSSCPEDEMSNEEFQRKVEAFITRQQRIRREEEYSVL
ncbi:hypothetical protein F2P56_036451 [Juglans regia]|uniref:Uncharacterized protein LOC109020733 n=2 Tax=Juglans regia TaxID=51240 RepID=A0A2I4HRM7_JUGRE|nr:uncharacterized protein LOC109020733 [Juglans regia]KAF5443937.1 hypothetical protein F2P56_036451 [Juglans regia]